MRVKWDTYVNHISHGPNFDIGCFRCHDDRHVSSDGKTISAGCSTCHVLLAFEEEDPKGLEFLNGQKTLPSLSQGKLLRLPIKTSISLNH